MVALVALIPSRGWTAVAAIVTGLSAGSAMSAAPSRGAFASEIVYAFYEATPNFSAGPPPTDATPLAIEVRTASARISSVNWAGKMGAGRSLKAAGVPGPDLGAAPAELPRRVRG